MMVLIENVEDAAAFKDFSAEAAEGGGGAGDPAPVIAATTPAPAAAPAPVEAEAAPVAAAAVAPAPSGSGARVAASPLAKVVSGGSLWRFLPGIFMGRFASQSRAGLGWPDPSPDT